MLTLEYRIYIYIYIHICTHTYIYINNTHTQQEMEMQLRFKKLDSSERNPRWSEVTSTRGCHMPPNWL